MNRRITAFLAVFGSVCVASTAGCSTTGGGSSEAVYSITASGSAYADGILLPELTADQSALRIMMSLSYQQLEELETEDDPQPLVQCTKIWKNAYGTDIAFDVVAESQWTEYLSTAVASGTSPDIIPAENMTFPVWSAKGLVANLDDQRFSNYLDLGDEELGFNQAWMEQYNFQGHPQWAIIQEPAHYYTVYNKTKFENQGQKTPMDYYLDNDSWTWSRFVETAKSMTDVSAGEYGFTGWMLFPYMGPYQMIGLDNETGQATLSIDSGKYVGWITEVYNLYQRDRAARRSYDLQEWRSTFPAGTDAMCFCLLTFDSSSYEMVVKVAKELGSDEFGIAPYPIYDMGGETERIVPVHMEGYSISAGALHPEAAAAYIRLETLVRKNILSKHSSLGYLEKVLTDEEKQMLQDTAGDQVVMDMSMGMGDCYSILDTQLVPPIYYDAHDSSVQAEIDSVKPLLQAEIDDYNSELAERQ